MKKIFVISNMYPTSNHLSYGIFVKNQVEALRKAGMDVEIGANTNPATGMKNALKKYTLWALKVMKKGIFQKKSISITHAHYVFPSGVFSLFLKKLFKIPYVVTAHGGDIEKMAKKNATIRKWTTTILQESAHIIAVGPTLAEQIEIDFQVPKDKITIMSMGVSREVFKIGDQSEARKLLKLSSDEFLFSFVGNVIRQKGVEELLQAFQQVKLATNRKVKLAIIGSRRDTSFMEKIAPLLNDDVLLIDPVKQADLVTWFQASDVFVLPSHIEGFGLVALEAIACGIPVIASDVGGLSSLLANDAGHLVASQNASALKEEMLKSLESENYFNSKETEKILYKHDEKNIIKDLISIYETAVPEGNK
ncbi:glycosyltransferase [Psychrobacillus sp. FSL H8-0487]|uniref:glycosyltransferase n=1 Tax=Psychrobacillus sp. FSL H8-0487 TaxID=2921391 RepID=UPI0030F89864